MALSAGQDNLKQVPWLSLAEWYHVYEQVYSADLSHQKDAYETMLAWKVRMPKLPVGVDCTLSIIQVCLRDREWTPKIDCGQLPIDYENDLCLMYSTTIMRFLNHVGNIGATKQTSLYNIAKRIKIPEWIVNLRHDAAHGHELPSLNILRVAANFLLSWLHEEYWMAEATVWEESCVSETKEVEMEDAKEIDAFKDLLELWTATGLYIHAGYRDIMEIPDSQLQDTLEDLRVYALNSSKQADQDNDCEDLENTDNAEDLNIGKSISGTTKYDLYIARDIVLTEITRYFGKKQSSYKENVIINALLTSGSFFPKDDMLLLFNGGESVDNLWSASYLPAGMLKFWQDILLLLQKKKMLGHLVLKMIEMARKESVNKQKRLLASLWTSSIIYAYVKLTIAKKVTPILERKLWAFKKKLSLKILNLKIKEEVNNILPGLNGITWFDLSGETPPLFKNEKFVREIIMDINEFTAKFVPPLLELAMSDLGMDRQKKLMDLIKVYLFENHMYINVSDSAQLYSVEKLSKVRSVKCAVQPNDEATEKNECSDNEAKNETSSDVGNNETRTNTSWRMASMTNDWAISPIGLLPWQLDSVEFLKPVKSNILNVDTVPDQSDIIPGIISIEDLGAKDRINWNAVLRKRKRPKKKQETSGGDEIIERAIQAAKKRK